MVWMGNRYEPPEAAGPYLPTIRDAADRAGIPWRLLARVLEQESGYREPVIQCEETSSAGALGIAQIIPRWHPEAEPCDPHQAIRYAAGYLSRLHERYGSWAPALAAYNWGPGNVDQKGMANAPRETKDYVNEILSDVEPWPWM